jgi:hypothetical protein
MFGIDDAITAGSNLVTTIVNKFAPDATTVEHDNMTLALTEMNNQYAEVLGQLKINEAEATNPHLFVAGWRPFIGWTCGIGLAYVSIIEPLARFIAVVIFAYTGTFPVISTEITLQILLGMLGIGAQRTFEKTKGVETKRIK